MNKKESKLILETYKTIYYSHEICNIDKSDTIREFKFMLDGLGLKTERYIIENEIIAERNSLNYTQREIYKMIFDTFVKYGVYVNYNLDEIENYFDVLQFKMNEEEVKCHNARMTILQVNAA